MLALVALWGVPALLRTHGEFLEVGLGRHVVGAFVRHDARGTAEVRSSRALLFLPFYFLTVFITFAPWSVKIPWLTRRLWQESRRLRSLSDRGRRGDRRHLHDRENEVAALHPAGLSAPRALAGEALARIRRGRIGRFRRWSLATAAVMLAVALIGFPLITPLFPSAALFKKAEPYLQPEMDFAAYDFDAPSLVWNFRSRVHGFLNYSRFRGSRLRHLAAGSGCRNSCSALVHTLWSCPRRVADQLYPKLPSGYRKFSTRGFDIANGRWVDLTLILKNT